MSPSFTALGVPAPLCAALSRRGLTEPFPIQAATLPDALAGRDVAGRAPTGSGKTLAFALAIAMRAAQAGAPMPRRPRALVLVPTRELAAQVQRELQALIDPAAGPVAAVYGGVGYGPQRRLLTRGVSAVVACPGRLEDLLSTGDVVLDRVELVVVDEADRMADMGFLPAVRRLVDRTPDSRQTLLFSATLDGDVDALITRYQRHPAHHAVEADPADVVEVPHLFWRTRRAERVQVTADVVGCCGPTIVFCRTRHGADRAAKHLARAGVKAVAIHGGRTQSQRDRALAAFTEGRAAALVATDVAARGIHVDDVAAVVHLDLPGSAKDYVHRSGRTGRAGAAGVVVALVPAEAGDGPARTLIRQLGRRDSLRDVDLDGLPRATGTLGPAERPPTSGHGRPGAPEPQRSTSHAEVSASPPRPAARRPAGDRRQDRPDSARVRERRGGRAHRRERASAGTVTTFHPHKGYGFISRSQGGDLFVHVSDLARTSGDRTLRPGQHVHFDVVPGRRGPQAVNVRPVVDGEAAATARSAE